MKISISIISVFLALALAAPTSHTYGDYTSHDGNGAVEQPGYHAPAPVYPPPTSTDCDESKPKATPHGGYQPNKPWTPEPWKPVPETPKTPEKPVDGGYEGTPSKGKDAPVEPAYPGEYSCYVPPATLDWTEPRTHTVIVGGEDLLRYEPAFVRAKKGDTIKFEFLAKNHTLTQSSFDAPCTALAGGINSGFRPNVANECGAQQFEFVVEDEKPKWFYCQQGNHCSVGMVFAVNPQKVGNTYSAFLNKAVATFALAAPAAPATPATSAAPVADAPATPANSTATVA